MAKIIGPFHELIPLDKLPLRGALRNENLSIIRGGAIRIEHGRILEVGNYEKILMANKTEADKHLPLKGKLIGLPGLIDAHTHICFAGSRHRDFSLRNGGSTYQEIANKGGGIWDTVIHTRESSNEELFQLTLGRAKLLLKGGVTTAEVKSGYGLEKDQEIKQLRCIKKVNEESSIDLISTCLSAHLLPKDFNGSEGDYLDYILNEIVPVIQDENLTKRFDIFVEKGAFSVKGAKRYLKILKQMGFDITVHGDQFSVGGSKLAVEMNAMSVDHLEKSGQEEINIISKSKTVATVLPGASIGLGENFAPARKFLDEGAIVAIASDWNPGSAPMGHLLTQAGILATYQKLTDAEVFAAITFRAAQALGIKDIGRIKNSFKADIVGFEADDFREILYHQGKLGPSFIWKNGELC